MAGLSFGLTPVVEAHEKVAMDGHSRQCERTGTRGPDDSLCGGLRCGVLHRRG